MTDTGQWRFGARSGKHDDLVLALAIAIWRAYGDIPGMGIFEWYRRRALGLPAGSGIQNDNRVRLRAPEGIGGATTLSGMRVIVGKDRIIEVTREDAAPLLRVGWRRCHGMTGLDTLDRIARKYIEG